MLDYWISPPFDPIVKVYVFNYTNIVDVLSGVEKKIKVEEVGPYVYTERIVKTGLIIEDDKITYRVSSIGTY
jgi:CD36 family